MFKNKIFLIYTVINVNIHLDINLFYIPVIIQLQVIK